MLGPSILTSPSVRFFFVGPMRVKLLLLIRVALMPAVALTSIPKGLPFSVHAMRAVSVLMEVLKGKVSVLGVWMS